MSERARHAAGVVACVGLLTAACVGHRESTGALPSDVGAAGPDAPEIVLLEGDEEALYDASPGTDAVVPFVGEGYPAYAPRQQTRPVPRLEPDSLYPQAVENAIIFRETTTGLSSIWRTFGPTRSDPEQFPTVPPEWRLVGAEDVDDDGYEDLLWHHQVTGSLYVWNMSASGGVTSYAVTGPVDPSIWRAVGFADADGNRCPDIVWQRRDAAGPISIWLFERASGSRRCSRVVSSGVVASVSNDLWTFEATGDLDGNGIADFIFRNNSPDGLGQSPIAVWYRGDGQRILAFGDYRAGEEWELELLFDVDFDGREEILWRHKVDGRFGLWYLGELTQQPRFRVLPWGALPPSTNWSIAAVRRNGLVGDSSLTTTDEARVISGGASRWIALETRWAGTRQLLLGLDDSAQVAFHAELPLVPAASVAGATPSARVATTMEIVDRAVAYRHDESRPISYTELLRLARAFEDGSDAPALPFIGSGRTSCESEGRATSRSTIAAFADALECALANRPALGSAAVAPGTWAPVLGAPATAPEHPSCVRVAAASCAAEANASTLYCCRGEGLTPFASAPPPACAATAALSSCECVRPTARRVDYRLSGPLMVEEFWCE